MSIYKWPSSDGLTKHFFSTSFSFAGFSWIAQAGFNWHLGVTSAQILLCRFPRWYGKYIWRDDIIERP